MPISANNALEAIFVPLDRFGLVDAMRLGNVSWANATRVEVSTHGTDPTATAAALGDALTGTGHAAVEVHAWPRQDREENGECRLAIDTRCSQPDAIRKQQDESKHRNELTQCWDHTRDSQHMSVDDGGYGVP